MVKLRRIDKFDKISADLALKIVALAVCFMRIIGNFVNLLIHANNFEFSF